MIYSARQITVQKKIDCWSKTQRIFSWFISLKIKSVSYILFGFQEKVFSGTFTYIKSLIFEKPTRRHKIFQPAKQNKWMTYRLGLLIESKKWVQNENSYFVIITFHIGNRNGIWNHSHVFKSDPAFALVLLWNHAYDFRSNCNSLS